MTAEAFCPQMAKKFIAHLAGGREDLEIDLILINPHPDLPQI
jgi:hypothetical protein